MVWQRETRRLTCLRKQPQEKQTGELLATIHAHILDCLIMYLSENYGGRFRAFLNYFPVTSHFNISQFFLEYFLFLNYFSFISYLFLGYFSKISQLFLVYFSVISHFSTSSQLLLDYHFSTISQLLLDYFPVTPPRRVKTVLEARA